MDESIDEPLWQHLTEQITIDMRTWRLAHPKATLREIETELDTRLNHMRARMLEDLALHSAQASWHELPPAQQPTCPTCGTVLLTRGSRSRTLQTHGGQDITLERTYAVCPVCATGLFPP